MDLSNICMCPSKFLSTVTSCFDNECRALELYPRGDDGVKGKYLWLYLELENANELTHGSNLYTEYSLSIKNQNGIGADEEEIGQSILTSCKP
ncbi:Active breakpoint cluster region-related protein [Bienertia sinuspersici]